MNRPTVMGGIAIAAMLALGSIPLRVVLNFILSPDMVVRISILTLALVYCVWTLSGRVRRVGTVTMGAVMFVLFTLSIIFQWTLLNVVWLAIGITWFTRCVARYRSVSLACLDGCIAIGAIFVAAVALTATGSSAIAIWCYFLAVALTAVLPAELSTIRWSSGNYRRRVESPFEQAFATADAALREIVRRQAVH